jgi:hypothetical protein
MDIILNLFVAYAKETRCETLISEYLVQQNDPLIGWWFEFPNKNTWN